jgi:hypothetical protein
VVAHDDDYRFICWHCSAARNVTQRIINALVTRYGIKLGVQDRGLKSDSQAKPETSADTRLREHRFRQIVEV